MKSNLLKGVFFLFLIILSSCKDDPEITEMDKILKFEIEDYDNLVQQKLIRADGKMTLKLIAYVPKEAAEANRVVKFKTLAGEFDVPEENKNEKTVMALNTGGKMLEASAYLTLGRVSGKFIIVASINAKPDYKTEQEIEVLPLAGNDFITFEIEEYDKLVSENKIKADGITKIKLIASVPKNSLEIERQIEFKTSDGSFDVTGDEKKVKTTYATLQNDSDDSYKAYAYLTLGTNAGNYTLSAGVKGSEVLVSEKVINVPGFKTSDVLQLSVGPESVIRADGLSIINAVASLTNTQAKIVTISSTDGMLLSSDDPKSITLDAGPDGKAEAGIQVGTDVKNYIITAKIPNSAISVSKNYTLQRAYPDQISIEPSSLAVDTTGVPVSLDIFMFRERGKVSTGTGINVKAYQLSDTGEVMAGRFTGTNGVSDSEGKITLHFYGDTGITFKDKPVTIEVSGRKDDGTPIVKKIDLRIK